MSESHALNAEQYRALQRDPIVLPKPAELFDYIVETLAARGLLEPADADPFRAQIPSGLFLLIPPRPEGRSLDQFVARNFLRPDDLRDVVVAPTAPYLMLDIEDGHRPGHGRSPMTVWEGIVYSVVFPMVFESHDLILGGTELASGAVPTLCLSATGRELRGCWYGLEGYPRRGAPTCSLRVGSPAAGSASAARASVLFRA